MFVELLRVEYTGFADTRDANAKVQVHIPKYLGTALLLILYFYLQGFWCCMLQMLK